MTGFLLQVPRSANGIVVVLIESANSGHCLHFSPAVSLSAHRVGPWLDVKYIAISSSDESKAPLCSALPTPNFSQHLRIFVIDCSIVSHLHTEVPERLD